MKIPQVLIETFVRLKSESPEYFKKLQKVFTVLIIVTGLYSLLPLLEVDFGFPVWVDKVFGEGGLILSIAGRFTSSLPVQEPEQVKFKIQQIQKGE